jgi:cytochrome c-type biogenesis protein
MGATFAHLASSGPLLLAVAVAALAGLVSFLSPCVLPLVPGYLSYVTGLAGTDLEGRTARPLPDAAGATRSVKGRVLAGTLLFIAGFAAVFVALNVLVASAALTLVANRRVLEIAGGALLIVLGLAFMGLVPGLQREWRVHRLPSAGLIGAPVFGAVFALSWIPCVGPTLGAVITLGTTTGSLGRAVTLAIAYCLGLGIPFLVFGLGFRRILGVVKAIRRNSRWVTRIGGGMLVVVGLLLVTGAWWHFVLWLQYQGADVSPPI